MKNEIKTTDLERKLIIGIAEDLYQPTNGAIPETKEECSGTYIWSAIDSSGIDSKSVAGVMGSLVKKKLAWSEGVGSKPGVHSYGDDDYCGLTEEGFKIYRMMIEGKIYNPMPHPDLKKQETKVEPHPDLQMIEASSTFGNGETEKPKKKKYDRLPNGTAKKFKELGKTILFVFDAQTGMRKCTVSGLNPVTLTEEMIKLSQYSTARPRSFVAVPEKVFEGNVGKTTPNFVSDLNETLKELGYNK